MMNKSISSNKHNKEKSGKNWLPNMQLNIKLLMNFKFYVPDERAHHYKKTANDTFALFSKDISSNWALKFSIIREKTLEN